MSLWALLFCIACYLRTIVCDDEAVRNAEVVQPHLRPRRFVPEEYDKSIRAMRLNSSVTTIHIFYGYGRPLLGYVRPDGGYLDVTIQFWMIWTDDRLLNLTGSAPIWGYDTRTAEIWLPDITLVNALHDHYTSVGYVGIDGNNGLTADVLFVARVPCTLDLSDFPYDTHECRLHFLSLSYLVSDLRYKVWLYRLEVRPRSTLWDVVSLRKLGQIMNRTSLEFLVRLRRARGTHRYTVTLPAAAVVLTTLVAFWMPATSGRMMTLGCVNLLALMLMLMKMESLLHVSVGVPRIVILHSLTMVLNAVTLALSVLDLHRPTAFMANSEPPKLLSRLLRRPIVLISSCLCIKTPDQSDSEPTTEEQRAGDREDQEAALTRDFAKPTQWQLAAQALNIIIFTLFSVVLIGMSFWSL